MYVSQPYTPQVDLAAESMTEQLQRYVRDMGALLQERHQQSSILIQAHRESLVRLAIAAESRDGDTGLHIVRVGQLAGALAWLLTGDRACAENMCQAAPMHDVGKIGIPDHVLKKPGPLTEEEWAVMYQHPAIGARILMGGTDPVFLMAAEISLGHHEKYDGTGYPSKLAGEAIPLSARIVGVVDYYDALTMDRVYRPRLPEEEVLDMMRGERGRKFDPLVVDAFFQHRTQMRQLREAVNARFAGYELGEGGTAIFEPLF